MEKKEIEFVPGLFVKAPHENAPTFVKASISIRVEDLGVWLRAKHKAGDYWVNLDVKESKGGKWYAAVSTYKPKEKEETKPAGRFDDLDDDIPFAPIGRIEAAAR
jgi:hypothetical protein